VLLNSTPLWCGWQHVELHMTISCSLCWYVVWEHNLINLMASIIVARRRKQSKNCKMCEGQQDRNQFGIDYDRPRLKKKWKQLGGKKNFACGLIKLRICQLLFIIFIIYIIPM